MTGPHRKPMRREIRTGMGLLGWSIASFFVSIILVLGLRVPVGAREATLAVMPLKVYATKPFNYLERGFQEMLCREFKKKGIPTISPAVVNQHPLAYRVELDRAHFARLGNDLGAGRILTGTLTQIGKAISVDLRLVDVTGEKDPYFLSMTSGSVEKLEETVEKIALKLSYEIAGVPMVNLVQVQGNQRIESEAILAVVRTKKGNPIDYERLDKDLRDIYSMGFFKDVQIETKDAPRGKTIILRVTEKPSIGRIAFEGNKKIKDEDLKEELGIKLYAILDQNEVKQGANRLRELYRQKGYYNADISSNIEPLPNNEVMLKFHITENEKVFVTRIQFSGNEAFNDGKLKNILETSEKGFFSWLTKSGYLDKKKLEFDVHKITSFYHNHGYIQAKVGAPTVEFEKDKGLTISFEVQEGPQYGVRSVNVQGDLIESSDELLKNTKIGKEKKFNRETVRTDVLTLKAIYEDKGYAFAEVRPLVKEDDKAYLTDITYDISEGEKVRFERINIYGNTTTRDKVIRRELKVFEGDYYSGKGLKRSMQNLNRLAYFEDVEIQTKKGRDEGLMILDFNVKERSTGSFSLGAGYSSEDAAFGVFSVGEKNLFGRGYKLDLSAKIGGETSEYDIRFVEPWLFDRHISLGLDIFKTEKEYDEYTKDSLGGAVTLGFPMDFLDEFTRWSIKYGYDDAEVTDILETASVLIKDMAGRSVTSSVMLEIARDSRDRYFNPSRGSVNTLSFEYAGGTMGGDVAFNRYKARTAWYFPLFWRTVIMAQGRWGYMEERFEDGKLPVYQKFRLGGASTIRGFDYGDVSPMDSVTGDRIGGEKMMVYNLELRFPLLPEQGVVGVLFFDTGNVWPEVDSYSFSDMRQSVGPGIRWYSPLGPLRLEYGIILDTEEGEKAGRWEFSVGGEF